MSKHKKFGPPPGPLPALPSKIEEVDALRWHMLNEKRERIKMQIGALNSQLVQTETELHTHVAAMGPKYRIDENTSINLETGEIKRKAPPPKEQIAPLALDVRNGKPAPAPAS